MIKNAVVVGGGVIGLTSAISLLEDGWKVHIIAEKLTPETTSDGTAAFWEPFLAEPVEKVSQWARDALRIYLKLMHTQKNTGIRVVGGYEYSKSKYEVQPWMKELLDHRLLQPTEIPSGFSDGCYYVSLMIETQLFIPWLVSRFKELGGTIEKLKVKDLQEVCDHPSSPSLILNCCGLGAKELVGDKELYAMRGQVVKVLAPWVKNFYTTVLDGNQELVPYVLPRADCVVVGGTAQKNVYNTTPDPNITRKILERADKIVPGLASAPVIKEWAGLRPARSSVRVESDKPMTAKDGRIVSLIHNYGHGGCGVTLSWGCAQEVLKLARGNISKL